MDPTSGQVSLIFISPGTWGYLHFNMCLRNSYTHRGFEYLCWSKEVTQSGMCLQKYEMQSSGMPKPRSLLLSPYWKWRSLVREAFVLEEREQCSYIDGHHLSILPPTLPWFFPGNLCLIQSFKLEHSRTWEGDSSMEWPLFLQNTKGWQQLICCFVNGRGNSTNGFPESSTETLTWSLGNQSPTV